MKYSPNFERDYTFYLNNVDNFTFCGTLLPKHLAVYDKNGVTAKEAFYHIESSGKNKPTKEPDLLNKLLLCKASVNFQIKQWAEGRADGTLPHIEFNGDGETLEWQDVVIKHKYFWWLPNWIKNIFKIQDKKDVIPVYKKSIAKEYNLPRWVIIAVEKQRDKIIQNNVDLPKWWKDGSKKMIEGLLAK